jgi:tripartite ATP-independent transporter DctP family solute receptor
VWRVSRLLGVILLSLLAAGVQAAERHWRFAIEEIRGSVQDRYAQRFKDLIEERTGGQVKVTVYPYGALGTSAQVTELVQMGIVELAFASPGHLGAVVPESQVFTLHFVLSPDEALAHRVLSDSEPLYEALRPAYRERLLHLLGIVSEGWMAWTADRALRTPEDFAGLKIRTMVSPLLMDVYEAYGATPTPMAYSEIYSALQLNMIDAQVNPVFAIEEMSFYEVQSHMMLPRHMAFITTLVTNPDFYDGLPEELRRTLDGVLEELEDYVFEVQRDLNDRRLETIRAGSDISIIALDDEARARFREASMPVRERFLEKGGARAEAVLDTLIEEFERLDQSGD